MNTGPLLVANTRALQHERGRQFGRFCKGLAYEAPGNSSTNKIRRRKRAWPRFAYHRSM